MSTNPSFSQEELKQKALQESQKADLLGEISNIRKTLQPVQGAETSALIKELDDNKLKLISLKPDGGKSSSHALFFLQNQINVIREKADQETQKFLLLEEISKAKEDLTPIKSAEASSLIKKIDTKNRAVKAITADASETSFSELARLQTEIDELHKQADLIISRAKQDFRRSSLLEELSQIILKVGTLETSESSSLMANLEDKKRKLEALIPDGSDVSSYALSSLQQEIDAMKEQVKSITGKGTAKPEADRRGKLTGFVVPTGMLGPTTQVLLGILSLLGSVYIGYMGYLQSTSQIRIPLSATQTVEAKQISSTWTAEAKEPNPITSPSSTEELGVSFTNPITNRASVELLIRDSNQPDSDPIARIVIPPGGTFPVKDLQPGSYEVETRPVYAVTTPQSPNCRIEWQPSNSYKGTLVITSSSQTVFQIRPFDVEPLEICFTETSIPPSSTPGQ
jgi:hypothetical protein